MDSATRLLLTQINGTLATLVPYLTGHWKATVQEVMQAIADHLANYDEG